MPYNGYTFPAPRGGLNLVDAIDSTPEEDAIEIVNLYPDGNKVKVRGGYQEHCDTTHTTPIRTLTELPLQDGTTKLISGVDSTLVEVSTATPDDIENTAVTVNDWNSTTFGSRKFLCNGTDTPQVYTGSGNCSDLNFTGPTLANLINVSSFKERLYFVEKDTLSFWYGGTKVVGGGAALTEYEADYFFKRGGRLLFAGSYTSQLGNTPSDLFFACSSQGEILFYGGSYPGGTWELVARFVIGKPMGYRAFVRVDNDIWVITDQGIVPVSLLFSGGPTVALNAIGRKVNSLVRRYAGSVGFSHLWHGAHWTQGGKVFIVVPKSDTDTFLLVCNTETGAWNVNEYGTAGTVTSIAILDGYPYFGGPAGIVYKGEVNQNDGDEAISFRARLPFSFFGQRGTFKKFIDIRPLMYGIPGQALSLEIDTDFKQSTGSSTISASPAATAEWDVATWDVASWADDASYLYNRYATKNQGHSGAIRISGSVQDAPLEFNAFEVRFETGGQV